MRGAPVDPVERTYELIGLGRLDDALRTIETLAQRSQATHAELAAYALALKGLDRMEDALAIYNRAAKAFPASPVAEHNVAALQGDLRRFPEAEAAARRAFAKGINAPETWAVLARAAQGQGRHEEAEAAYVEALRRRPNMADVHRDLAQLIWVRTEDVEAAAANLQAATKAFPEQSDLAIQLARVQQFGGQEEAAYSTLLRAIGRSARPDADLQASASILAGKLGESVAALRHAEAALALAPDNAKVMLLTCDAQLGLGRAGPAARLAEALLERAPDEQQALSRLATAWRIMGDPRYRRLFDYDAVVRGWTIDTPDGWTDLPSYLVDLAAALRAENTGRGHPFDQSLRNGSQSDADLTASEHPAVKAFFQAIDGPIHRHMQAIGSGDDPLRRRNTGEFGLRGIWSVRLRPNGYHVDHVHPMGWLSSACHIEIPAAVNSGGQEGWLKFGEPGVPTMPRMPAEHFVKPEPGRLVLFPSYMWHGTVPFSGDQERLSVAFDVVPA